MTGLQALCGIAFGFTDFVKSGTPEEIEEVTAIQGRIDGGGPISPGTVRRLKALPGHFHLVVAAEMWCPDCRVNVTAMDFLCRQQPNVTLSIITRARAEREMRTPLDLAHVPVPTAAILDEHYQLIDLTASGDAKGVGPLLKQHIRTWEPIFVEAIRKASGKQSLAIL